jgi:hypothetical protein
MATELIQRAVSYQGINATRIFYEPIFRDIDALGLFTIMPNVRNKKKMGFISKLEKIVQARTGCGFTPTGSMETYDRTISVSPCKINVKICIDQFENTLWKEKLKSGNNQFNVADTEVFDIFLTSVQQGAVSDIQRLLWFGNTASLDTDYNMTDGIWMVHIPALVAQNLIPYTNTNSGAPLAAGDAIDYLQAVYDAQPLALKGLPDNMKKFMVSGSIYDQYIKDLQAIDTPANGASTVINGIQTLLFNNIAVMPFRNWDYLDNTDLNSPMTHRILLTTPENLVVATDVFSDMNSFMTWYDMEDEVTKVKANFDLGTNYVHESLFSVGY